MRHASLSRSPISDSRGTPLPPLAAHTYSGFVPRRTCASQQPASVEHSEYLQVHPAAGDGGNDVRFAVVHGAGGVGGMCARIRRSGVLTPLRWCSGVRSKSQTDLRCNLLFTTLVWRTCSITPHSLAVQAASTSSAELVVLGCSVRSMVRRRTSGRLVRSCSRCALGHSTAQRADHCG